MTSVLRRYALEHRRALTAVLALFVGNLVFYVALTLPRVLAARQAATTMLEGQKQLGTILDEYAAKLQEVTLLESTRSAIDSLYRDTLRSNASRFPVIDRKIKELQAKFGLSPQSIAYAYSPLKREGLQQMTVSFRLKGSYKDLREFVSHIEQASDEEGRDLFFAIDRVSLVDSTETGRELNLEIAVVTYFQDDEIGVGPKTSRSGG